MDGNLNTKLKSKIAPLKVLILDVDGVLTDGRIIIDDLGNETKHFNVRDGHGIKLLLRYGIDVVLLTGRESRVVEHRARELGIQEIHQNAKNKADVLNAVLSGRKLNAGQVAYVGDDVVDIPVFRLVGWAVAVADASEDAKEAADYITKSRGGRGAVREICELILKFQGHWGDVEKRYQMESGIGKP